MMILLLFVLGVVVVAVAVVVVYLLASPRQLELPARSAYNEPLLLGPPRDFQALASPIAISQLDAEVTTYGEDLQRMGKLVSISSLSCPDMASYERALDAYDVAKNLLAKASTQHDLDRIASVLNSGREAMRTFL